MNKEDLIKMRDGFLDISIILDEAISLEGKEDTPEVIKESEALIGRFMLKLIELQSLPGM